MIFTGNIRKKLTDYKLLDKLFPEHEKRHLYLAPPFLVEDYVPVANVAYKSGILKVKMLRFHALRCLRGLDG